MAAPNRSLIVSEPILPHCPQYEPGVHFVSASIDKLSETILYYLQHDEARERIVENAYRLTTAELTFRNSIKKIMDEVDRVMCARGRIDK
jgi:spore maturation protein CgeB